MAVLIPVASGKGGVGKSVVAANLAWSMADQGARVVLADLDCGASNAHTLLGLKNTHPGIGNFLEDKSISVASLVFELDKPGMYFLPGDNLIPGAANMPFIRKKKLIKELADLDVDYVIMDLGAGSHYNTIDLFVAGNFGMVVAVPEPTSILNAYSFLKTAVYRLMTGALKAKSPEREAVHQFFCKPAAEEGGAKGLAHLLDSIAETNPSAAEKVRTALGRLQPRIVVNMVRSNEDANLAARLRQICGRQLDVRVAYIALTPWTDDVHRSVVDRQLMVARDPGNQFSRAINALATKVRSEDFHAFAPPLDAFEDLEALLDT